MKEFLKRIYFFLPVQLVFLHFRKYQLLLVFWLILLLIFTGNLAAHFGASSLFLAPEYLGEINFFSMFLLGGAMCVFTMSWNITTFIIHSRRIPYVGVTRNAFVVYCYNNSIIPLAFLIFSSTTTVRYQLVNEHSPVMSILWMQLGYYLGFVILLLISFSYFFGVSSDLVKIIFAKITNPSRIREFIPYDSLDAEQDTVNARSFISEKLIIASCEDSNPFNPRILGTILRRHHRNVVFATFASYIVLLLIGLFAEEPLLRIPAGAGFLLLFSIFIGFVGAFKYFMKSWETIGWVLFTVVLSVLVKNQIVDLRSPAYGINYDLTGAGMPIYDYNNLKYTFTPERYAQDKKTEEARLSKWSRSSATDTTKPTLIVITTSGGGIRSAYWTFRALQYADSITGGKVFKNTVMFTGASGGMIGATYWRSVHDAYRLGLLDKEYHPKYQANIGKDILNAIIFSLASNDLISPFNKVNINGRSYPRDRGYAMEQEMMKNTDGLLDREIGYFHDREANGIIPQMIINGTIINDGRKLIISSQPTAYLTQPEYSVHDNTPTIDAVDFSTFFARQQALKLRLTTALRMNATFPLVLPVVKLPSKPYMNVMDAGLRDNFGMETANRYLYAMRGWIEKNADKVILLEVRDTRENEVVKISDENSLGKMLMDPLFVIQEKWEVFQSYDHTYFKDAAPYFLNNKLHIITLKYVPQGSTEMAELNFHLTKKEQENIYNSISNPDVQAQLKKLSELLQ